MNRFLRNLLIVVLLLTLVAAGGYYGRKALKRANVNRLVAQAQEYLGKQDWRNAQLCLQRALQINPLSLDATRSMAGLMETVGSPTAVGWRARVVDLKPGVTDYRLDWADTALREKDLNSATNALAGIPGSERTSGRYWSLVGAAAWSRQDRDEAGASYQRALELEPTNLVFQANLATIRLLSTNLATAQAARADLERLSTNAAVRLVALRHLRDFALALQNTNDALRYSGEAAGDPAALLPDKMGHLSILKKAGDASFPTVLEQLKQEARNAPATAFAVGKWIAENNDTTNALAWLQGLPPEVRTNQPVPLMISDCLISQHRWQDLKTLAESEDWQDAECYRFAIISLAERLLGEDTAAKASWRRAFREASGRLDRLSRLVQATMAWRWPEQYEELLTEIVAAFPREKWAINALTGKYYVEGNTRAIEKLLFESYEANKDDLSLKNNLANILLLRKSQLDLAHALAKEAYDASPENPFYASTYAYSLYTQGNLDEAGRIIAALQPASLKNPAIAAYCGVIQAHSAKKDDARKAIATADAAKVMLPEERELIQLAKSAL